MPIGHKAFCEKYAHEYAMAKSMGNQYYPDMMGRFPWEISCNISKKKMGELFYKLYLLKGEISSSFCINFPESEEQARYHSVFFIVWLKPNVIDQLGVPFKPAAMAKLN